MHGQFYENTVVVQYDKDLLEVWDEAKRLRCEWFNDYEKTASKPPMVIADLDVIQLDFRGMNYKLLLATFFFSTTHPGYKLISWILMTIDELWVSHYLPMFKSFELIIDVVILPYIYYKLYKHEFYDDDIRATSKLPPRLIWLPLLDKFPLLPRLLEEIVFFSFSIC